jgi:hypothetical protein|tara:strand:+ start:173 stop:469 length:297 start_codon:yes stop_codon:yes gene_type:complete
MIGEKDILLLIPKGIFKTIKETVAVYHENEAEGFCHGDAFDTDRLRDMLEEDDYTNNLDEFDREEITDMIELNEALYFLTNFEATTIAKIAALNADLS